MNQRNDCQLDIFDLNGVILSIVWTSFVHAQHCDILSVFTRLCPCNSSDRKTVAYENNGHDSVSARRIIKIGCTFDQRSPWISCHTITSRALHNRHRIYHDSIAINKHCKFCNHHSVIVRFAIELHRHSKPIGKQYYKILFPRHGLSLLYFNVLFVCGEFGFRSDGKKFRSWSKFKQRQWFDRYFGWSNLSIDHEVRLQRIWIRITQQEEDYRTLYRWSREGESSGTKRTTCRWPAHISQRALCARHQSQTGQLTLTMFINTNPETL